MAMIDYGAILMIDGKKYNDSMFMDTSDSGFVPEKAYDEKHDCLIDVKGNYFVYAGDKDFMIVFYRTHAHVIAQGRIIYSPPYNFEYPGETRFFDGLPTVTFEHLDKNRYISQEHLDRDDVQFLLERYGKKWGRLYAYRLAKTIGRNQTNGYTARYVARWEYKGKQYEVIYGYGIDPDKEVWDDIKNDDDGYGFTDVEIQAIDRCFE